MVCVADLEDLLGREKSDPVSPLLSPLASVFSILIRGGRLPKLNVCTIGSPFKLAGARNPEIEVPLRLAECSDFAFS